MVNLLWRNSTNRYCAVSCITMLLFKNIFISYKRRVEMKNKILTKVVSFLLVICLAVPIFSGLGNGLQLGGVTTEASMLQNTSTAYFKSGSTNYLKGTAKYSTSHKVITVKGALCIPAAMLTEALGITDFDSTVTHDGITYVEAVHGSTVGGTYYISVSNMNLIAVSTSSNVFANVTNTEQLNLMKRFIFDSMNYDYSQNDVIDLSTVKTEHPYLAADQSHFDYLNSVYNGAETDETLKGYLDTLVAEADSVYSGSSYSDGSLKDNNLNSTQTSLSDMPYYTYDGDTSNGYDVGGRQNESSSHTARIAKLAYAYQVTRDEKYARLALDYAVAICEWEHWGAGHFLNAADASMYMAYAYDWCYNIWKELDIDKFNKVKTGFFTKGVLAGVYDSVYEIDGISYLFVLDDDSINCPWRDNKVGQNSYKDRTNNWGAVCTSGMILAALAFIGETDDWTDLTITAISKTGKSYEVSANPQGIATKTLTDGTVVGTTYQSASMWLINNNLAELEYHGLDMYVPDGSYIESASYWNYGTSSLFRTIAALDATCGTDFGLSSCWGLDKTAYFSYHVQSSDGDSWKYHDDNTTTLPTPVNALFGAIIGDDNIVGYRKYLIEKGAASVTYFDTFKYDKDVVGFDEMALDYYMEGADGFTTRSSWNDGSIYAAFMGGHNYYTHVQVDSGAFIYYNNGTRWFEDIGTEDYNVKNFGYGTQTTSMKYYPVSAEGNNVLFTTGLTYGQAWSTDYSAYAPLTRYGSNVYGSYSIIDQTAIYSPLASSASRGMLLTNDRKTVVIQDEVVLKDQSNPQDFYWVGHLSTGIDITFSDDGKTAYLSDGNSMIRCTIVSNGDYTFTKKNFEYSDDYMILDYTDATGNYSTNLGGQPQKDYSQWQRLMIECKDVTTLKLAVVIEEYVPGDNFAPNYTWTPISTWNNKTLTSDSRSYDGKVLIDMDFDLEGIGSLNVDAGNINVSNVKNTYGSAISINAVSGNTGASEITILSGESRSEYASIGNGMIVAEFDIAKGDSMPSGITLELRGTDIYPIISETLTSSSLGTLSSSFTHITIVLDEQDNTYYIYSADTCVKTGNFKTSSYEDLKLVLSTSASSSGSGSLILDNILVRTYTESYTALDSVLAGTAKMSTWADRDTVAVPSGIVAKLTPKNGGTVQSLTSFKYFETNINTGNYSHVEIFRDLDVDVNIKVPLTVDTNGYEFGATSASYICQVDGEIYTYQAGSLTVTYHIGSNTYTKTVTAAEAASYTASSSDLTGIREQANYSDDGSLVSYSYHTKVAGTWAKTLGGDILSGADLIVRSDNCEFYIGEEPYSGIYVTVSSDGTVTGGTLPTVFFKTVLSRGSAYERISVTNSFEYESSSNAANIGGRTNLYLNGNTITYISGSGQHLFYNAGHELNVYGPGTINNNSSSNVIISCYQSSNTKRFYSTFYNVTINSDHIVTDLRSGTTEFRNCDITLSKNKQMFTVDNWSSPFTNSYLDDHQIGVLIVNGGSIYAPLTSSYLFDISDNVGLEIKGNVDIIAPKAKSLIYMLKAKQSTNPTVSGCVVESIEKMFVNLGEFTTNVTNMYNLNNITDEELASVVKCAEGVNTADKDAYTLADGCIWALTGSDVYPYRSVKEEDAATVIWKSAGSSCTQKWIAGVTPIVTEAAKNLITSLTTSGFAYMYAYDFSPFEGGVLEAGKTYTVTAKEIRKITSYVNVNLSSYMTMNIYIEKNENVGYNSFEVNGYKSYTYNTAIATVDGKDYYVLSIKIAPKDAAENFSVLVDIDTAPNDGVSDSFVISTDVSLLEYAESLLAADDTSEETKKLLSALLNYICAVNKYEGDHASKLLAEAVISEYGVSLGDDELVPANSDTSAIRTAISSVWLDLGGRNAFVFRFNPYYTGTVTFTYTSANGKTVTKSVTVTNGKSGGDDTYKLILPSYDMAADITIDTGTASAVYNLAAYYKCAVQSGDALYDVLSALYLYSEMAKLNI